MNDWSICREANESVLTVVGRMCEQQSLQKVSAEAQAQIVAILEPMCATFFRLLLAGAAGMVPSSRIYRIAEATVSMLKVSISSQLFQLQFKCADRFI